MHRMDDLQHKKLMATDLNTAAMQGNLTKINEILDKGLISANSRDSEERVSAIHFAAFYGQADALKLLLDRGADINDKSDSGWTPLHDAAWRGSIECILYLLCQDSDQTIKNNNCKTWADIVTERQGLSVLKEIKELYASSEVIRNKRLAEEKLEITLLRLSHFYSSRNIEELAKVRSHK